MSEPTEIDYLETLRDAMSVLHEIATAENPTLMIGIGGRIGAAEALGRLALQCHANPDLRGARLPIPVRRRL